MIANTQHLHHRGSTYTRAKNWLIQHCCLAASQRDPCRLAVLGLALFAAMIALNMMQDSPMSDRDLSPEESLQALTQLSLTFPHTLEAFDENAYHVNARAVMQQREHLRNVCRVQQQQQQHTSWFRHKPTDPMVEEALAAVFHPPSKDVTMRLKDTTALQPCSRVVWDLGANIGDAVGQFISAGFLPMPCGKGTKLNLNLDTGFLTHDYLGRNDGAKRRKKLRNILISSKLHSDQAEWAYARLQAASSQRNPEDYCYFGLEGNPELTDRLQNLAARTMQTAPRPVRHITMLTETVITDHDGPVEMFLEARGGMGSSIVEGKAKRSHNDILAQPAVVRGITLETLLAETVILSPDSYLLIKMDVEGAEYAVLNHSWSTLCEAVQQHGVHISLLLELHGRNKIGKNEALDAFGHNKILQKLSDCGVHMAKDGFHLLPGH